MPVIHGFWEIPKTQILAYNLFISHLSALRCYNHFRCNLSRDGGATASAGQRIMLQAFILSRGMAGIMAPAFFMCTLQTLSSSFVFSLFGVLFVAYNCSYPFHSLGSVVCFYPLLV